MTDSIPRAKSTLTLNDSSRGDSLKMEEDSENTNINENCNEEDNTNSKPKSTKEKKSLPKQPISNFVLSVVSDIDNEASFKDNQIVISLIKNNINLTKNCQLDIKFSYNLLTDTGEGIVSELKNEIDLTDNEIIELNTDLDSLSNIKF